MKKYICLILLLLSVFLGGCSSSNKMKDGFYTAEMSDFSNGWKEYLCIMVKDDTIVYAEFNAKDSSGYIKAWDNAYMEKMNASQGTYPNEYTRSYVSKLIDAQTSGSIDTVTGATSSGNNFRKLSEAVISQAKKGKPDTIVVE
ncbi:MAG: FMN-binding protein [Lachnospiraceae bacterium]|nr:FMN-binding protein [Lachnospiraceae bacterium]MDE7334364.1 FMN-binding protein [Lachnospiraceae bacterium]